MVKLTENQKKDQRDQGGRPEHLSSKPGRIRLQAFTTPAISHLMTSSMFKQLMLFASSILQMSIRTIFLKH